MLEQIFLKVMDMSFTAAIIIGIDRAYFLEAFSKVYFICVVERGIVPAALPIFL